MSTGATGSTGKVPQEPLKPLSNPAENTSGSEGTPNAAEVARASFQASTPGSAQQPLSNVSKIPPSVASKVDPLKASLIAPTGEGLGGMPSAPTSSSMRAIVLLGAPFNPDAHHDILRERETPLAKMKSFKINDELAKSLVDAMTSYRTILFSGDVPLKLRDAGRAIKEIQEKITKHNKNIDTNTSTIESVNKFFEAVGQYRDYYSPFHLNPIKMVRSLVRNLAFTLRKYAPSTLERLSENIPYLSDMFEHQDLLKDQIDRTF